jgi:regulator of replication initiation timing
MTDKPLTLEEIDWVAKAIYDAASECAGLRAEVERERNHRLYAEASAHALRAENEKLRAARADNERLKACLHDYENTYPEAKGSLRAEVEHWKAIAQTHNDSLVARIEENKALRAENERLREALEKIVKHGDVGWMHDTARAALQTVSPKD